MADSKKILQSTHECKEAKQDRNTQNKLLIRRILLISNRTYRKIKIKGTKGEMS